MEESNKNIMGWVVTVVVLAAIGLGIYYLLNPKQPVETMVNEGSSYYVSLIPIKHQYKDGKHTYAGSLDLPNPCYNLEASIVSKAGSTSTAVININTPTSLEEICAQVITKKDFKVEMAGSPDMMVEGVLNGKAVELNIFEVPAGQNIDEVQIDTKG